jgi:hypothetical protein
VGNLLVCNSCSKAVASGAFTCPSCNAPLKVKGLNLLGLIGVLVCFGSCASCLVIGPGALVPLIVGLLLVSIGKSYSPKWGSLRRFGLSDYQRLQVAPGSGAALTPGQTQFLTVVGDAVVFVVLLSGKTCGGSSEPVSTGTAVAESRLGGGGSGAENRVLDATENAEAKTCETEAVARFILARHRAVEGCYRKEHARDPVLKGSVTVQMTVGENGRVTGVEVLEDRLANDAVLSCLKTTIRRWALPFKGEMCTAAYTFEFPPHG